MLRQLYHGESRRGLYAIFFTNLELIVFSGMFGSTMIGQVLSCGEDSITVLTGDARIASVTGADVTPQVFSHCIWLTAQLALKRSVTNIYKPKYSNNKSAVGLEQLFSKIYHIILQSYSWIIILIHTVSFCLSLIPTFSF